MHGARVIALRGNFDQALDARARARRSATRSRSSTRVNPFRLEGQKTAAFEIARGARRARRAVHPGRQRRQHHRLLEGLPGDRAPRRGCSASRPRAPRRSCTAQPVENPETVASAIRIGNPARWEEAMDGDDRARAARVERRHRRRRSSTPTACSPPARACSASRPAPPSVAGLLAHGADGARAGRLRAHRPRAEGPADRARARRARSCRASRARRGRAGGARRDAAPAPRPRPGVLGQPRAGLRRASPPRWRCTSSSRSRRPGASRSRPTSQIARDRAQPRACAASSGCTRPTRFTFRIRSDIPLSGGLGTSAAAYRRRAAWPPTTSSSSTPTCSRSRPSSRATRQRRRRAARRLRRSAPTARATRFDAAGRAGGACSSCPHEAVRTRAGARRAARRGADGRRGLQRRPRARCSCSGSRAATGTSSRAGSHDRLHQPRRAHLYPRSMELVERARELGALGATISGAGPTVLVWCDYEQTGRGRRGAARARPRAGPTSLRVPFEPQGADVARALSAARRSARRRRAQRSSRRAVVEAEAARAARRRARGSRRRGRGGGRGSRRARSADSA